MMSQTTDSGPIVEGLNESLSIVRSPDREDAEWVLHDRNSGEEIPVWPSEVPEMVAMLEAFESKVG